MFHVRTIMIHRVNGRELDKAISEAGGHEFETASGFIRYESEDSDSMSLEKTITADFDEYRKCQWEDFCATGFSLMPDVVICAYLTKLCYEGSIPAGTYQIEW